MFSSLEVSRRSFQEGAHELAKTREDYKVALYPRYFAVFSVDRWFLQWP